MLENFLADLKASLTASHIVRDIEIDDEFITCEKYSYHLQKGDEFIIRWDNAPHHKELSTFPYHVHDRTGVHKSKEMTMDEILEELSEKVLDE